MKFRQTPPTRRGWSKYQSGEIFSKSLLPLKKYTTFEFLKFYRKIPKDFQKILNPKFTVKYIGFSKIFKTEIYRKIG